MKPQRQRTHGHLGHRGLHQPAASAGGRIHRHFATLAGWVVFGYAPDVWTVLGIALIAVCGVMGVRAR